MSDLPERIAARIAPAPDGCWLWTGSVDKDGYGRVHWRGQWQLAHRVVLDHVRAIKSGLEVDHLCRTRLCVNPDHLEAVTRAENNRRKWTAYSECKNGHQLTGDNVYNSERQGIKRRVCRACQRERQRACQRRKLGAA